MLEFVLSALILLPGRLHTNCNSFDCVLKSHLLFPLPLLSLFPFSFPSSLAVNFIVALFLHIMGTLEVGIRAGQTFFSFFHFICFG